MTGTSRQWPKRSAVDQALMPLLPGADFADAYSQTISDLSIDAVTAAKRAFASPPAWAKPLMLLRDVIVLPFGLKTRFDPSWQQPRRIGIFPVLSEAPERVVLGFDDSHQDFRVIVDVASAGADHRLVTITTLVRTNGTLGRLYLATVMPFHKLIVPAALAQVAEAGEAGFSANAL